MLPAAGPGGAEYLVAAIATNGTQVTNGISATYSLTAGSGVAATVRATRERMVPAGDSPLPNAEFHTRLREMEGRLVRDGRAMAAPRPAALVTLPAVGDHRAFNVCSTTSCTSFTSVTATARYVGARGAIYLDDAAPSGGLTDQDIQDVGVLFDTYMYPIDTTAFGRESDLDDNGVVAILLSPAVNTLSGDCSNGSVILGYFYGADLVPSEPGSNGGEVFYSRVPDASNPGCNHTRERVLRGLAPTFIHEFQHMISFNQHVLVRGGSSENVWLNEGLSHFAEELGGRLIPDGPAQGDAATRQSQFLQGDVYNASGYFGAPGNYFLVNPGSSLGYLQERGAQWLFVRWLADQYDAGDVRGTTVTRALVQTRAIGSDNVTAVTGAAFDQLVGAWQLANYLDNLDGLPTVPSQLQYLSVNLRATMAQLSPVYPLRPDSSSGTSYARSGTLRAGSGQHVRFVLPANAAAVPVRLQGGSGQPISPLVAARLAVARIR